jgi:hypothetical protein
MVIHNPKITKGLLKETLTSTELVERLNAETPALFILKDFNRF